MLILIPNYLFDPIDKTVEFTDYVSVNLDEVISVYNRTVDRYIYIKFDQINYGGVIGDNLLQFYIDTTGMQVTDELVIYFDDAVTTSSTGVLPVGNIDDIITELEGIKDAILGQAYTVIDISTATYTVSQTEGHVILLVDATSADVEIFLPTAVASDLKLTVKKIDSSVNIVTITPDGSETINDDPDVVLTSENDVVTIVSNNTDWELI